MPGLGFPRSLGKCGGKNKVAAPGMARVGRARLRLTLEGALAPGHLLPWVPVFIGIGVGLWFARGTEPDGASYSIAAAVLAAMCAVRLRGPELAYPFAVAIACVALGWVACGIRVHMAAAPMLDFRYYGPVMGRVVWTDRSQTDAIRITLADVRLDRVAPDRTPHQVRLSLRSAIPGHDPFPGEVVMTTAHLSAPDGPVEPGGFDFRRMAFFDGLGAVGYTTVPLLLWAPVEPGTQTIDRLRSHLSTAMRAAMPGQAGAFAAGAMTGDRSGINAETVAALRDSSLAHLLAISGMNLAFLIGFVFALLRYGVALVPVLALRVNAKKIAAAVSIGVAGFYLLLSGANVATERAFIMVTVMLAAVLLDRRALTLRSVGIAGTIILLWKPESLLEPGFQMSFAATVALIAGFRAAEGWMAGRRAGPWLAPVFALVLSSVIGGIATAPYAAAHFNRFADYGLIANLLTVPVMGAVVMPAGAIAALLAPLGLAAPALWVMERGAAWILWVAHWVAGWEGSVTHIPSPGNAVLPMITLAAVWLILWRGWARWLALPVAGMAVALWGMSGRPAVLVSGDGALVGVMGPEGRALSAPRGAGFAARSWLENDGDGAAQEIAAQRPGLTGPEGAREFSVAGVKGVALKGRGALDRLAEACARADLVVIAAEVEAAPQGCLVLDETRLRASGPLALLVQDGGLRIVAARVQGRLWSAPERGDPLPAMIRP
jgi:competence protein ComEC